jgi:hypothetical protein
MLIEVKRTEQLVKRLPRIGVAMSMKTNARQAFGGCSDLKTEAPHLGRIFRGHLPRTGIHHHSVRPLIFRKF